MHHGYPKLRKLELDKSKRRTYQIGFLHKLSADPRVGGAKKTALISCLQRPKKEGKEKNRRRRRKNGAGGQEAQKKEVGDLATSLEPRESGTEVRRISDTAT